MFRYVTLPSLLPWIMSAVKIGIGSAIISAVVAEMVGADHGLGWSVTFALQEFDMTGAVTSMIMMVILAMILYGLLALLERWLFRWKGDGIASSVTPM
jgi:NitT/TauT family transport system permease protein